MAEKSKARRKTRRDKSTEHNNRIKRMSIFGLKIETRDDFDASNYGDFQNVRREIKDTSHCHRVGPAPVLDFTTKPNYHFSTSPGSLDSDIEDNDNYLHPDFTATKSKAGCRGLIMYFANLGRSEGDEKIDFEFLDSLLRGGADINFQDRHGQTCMHEIARNWHTDVAQFVLSRNANIDKCDNFGRTPLHLATAVNYPEMVFWLLNNGAKIDARTDGENQTPIHYAAKHNAEDAIKVLLHMGANIGDKDYKNRTPLFVAAETGRSEACRFLLEYGAPAGVYDDGGTSALTLMIEKMPDVAKIALGQFEVVDKALRKKYFYLNYLEAKPWNRNSTIKRKPLGSSKARTPLETICTYNETELIMHPVILRLIAIKWQLFGKMHTAKNTCINLVYTILWTILGVTMPKNDQKQFYTPLGSMAWRVTLEIISLGLAFYLIAKEIIDFRKSESRMREYKEWKFKETERDLQYCHDRWPEEKRYLTSEMSLIKASSKKYFDNGWNIFELVTNLVLTAVVITRILACTTNNNNSVSVHYKAFSVFLIMLWLRFMRSCQCYQSLGPFITMLGHVITDTLKFGFLFCEFFIPYVCVFWILFGGRPGTEFHYFNDVIYQVFLMTLVDEYEREDIMKDDKIMAQILVGTYLAIASVVCINLYIALMSQTFTRVYQNAKATAFMQQAFHLMKIESMLGKKQKNRVKRFMTNECSPQIIYDSGTSEDDGDDQNKLMMYRMAQSIHEIKDKLLVVVMNTTNAATPNTNKTDEEGNASLNDVNTQVEEVHHKCDNLQTRLDELQTHFIEMKELLSKQPSIQSTNLEENADDDAEVDEYTKLPRKDKRSVSSVNEKLNQLIDVLTGVYTQNQRFSPFPYQCNTAGPAYQTKTATLPKYNQNRESDSPCSSYNYNSYYLPSRTRFVDRNYSSMDNVDHITPTDMLSEFAEFQKFKEFRQHRRDDLGVGGRRRISPPSYNATRYNKFSTQSVLSDCDYHTDNRCDFSVTPSKQQKIYSRNEALDSLKRYQRNKNKLAARHNFDSDYDDDDVECFAASSDVMSRESRPLHRHKLQRNRSQSEPQRRKISVQVDQLISFANDSSSKSSKQDFQRSSSGNVDENRGRESSIQDFQESCDDVTDDSRRRNNCKQDLQKYSDEVIDDYRRHKNSKQEFQEYCRENIGKSGRRNQIRQYFQENAADGNEENESHKNSRQGFRKCSFDGENESRKYDIKSSKSIENSKQDYREKNCSNKKELRTRKKGRKEFHLNSSDLIKEYGSRKNSKPHFQSSRTGNMTEYDQSLKTTEDEYQSNGFDVGRERKSPKKNQNPRTISIQNETIDSNPDVLELSTNSVKDLLAGINLKDYPQSSSENGYSEDEDRKKQTRSENRKSLNSLLQRYGLDPKNFKERLASPEPSNESPGPTEIHNRVTATQDKKEEEKRKFNNNKTFFHNKENDRFEETSILNSSENNGPMGTTLLDKNENDEPMGTFPREKGPDRLKEIAYFQNNDTIHEPEIKNNDNFIFNFENNYLNQSGSNPFDNAIEKPSENLLYNHEKILSEKESDIYVDNSDYLSSDAFESDSVPLIEKPKPQIDVFDGKQTWALRDTAL